MDRFNRRKFIGTGIGGGLVCTTNPVTTLLNLMLMGATSTKLEAAAQGVKRYIAIQEPGAPPRWMSDLLLNPFNEAGFVANPYMGTVYRKVGGRYVEVDYQLKSIGGYLLPPMWGFNLPTPGSATVQLSSILKNILHIRGMDMGIGAHSFAQRLQFLPSGAARSNSALTAEISDMPLAAINLGTREYLFKSVDAITNTNLSSADSNKIKELLQPFSKPNAVLSNAEFNHNLDALSTAIAHAQAKLDMDRSHNQAEFASVLRSRNDLWKMLRTRYPDPDVEWNALKAKYQLLINRSLGAQYPGINDAIVGAPIAERTQAKYSQSHLMDNVLVSKTDDLRTMFAGNTQLLAMANAYAMIEFALKNNLSSSLSVGLGGFTQLNLPGHPTRQNVDEHFTGSVVSLLLNTMRQTAVASCTLELVSVLKDLSIFEDTVIDLHGEFNRAPRKNLSGADHAFHGASLMLITGAVQNEPIIVGDIMSDFSNGNATDMYPGTWGNPAPMKGILGGKIVPAHKAATLAAIFGVPSPTQTAASLIEKTGTGTNTTIKLAEGLTKGKIVV